MTVTLAVTFELLAFAHVMAQTPSKWCEYLPRSPKELVAHAHLGDTADVTMSGGQFPSRVLLRYTGNVRQLSSGRGRFLRYYFKSVGPSGTDTLFRHEVEFTGAGDSSFWLPIQETMFQNLRSELASGDTSTLFLLWAGSYRRSIYDSAPIAVHVSREYLFLVNEFTSRASSDDWRAALSTCSY